MWKGGRGKGAGAEGKENCEKGDEVGCSLPDAASGIFPPPPMTLLRKKPSREDGCLTPQAHTPLRAGLARMV